MLHFENKIILLSADNPTPTPQMMFNKRAIFLLEQFALAFCMRVLSCDSGQ